jgi:pyruvate formate lyase activating enzyme
MQGGEMAQAVVFDIERFAVHDGPGIRTTVFLKGCPLQCAWCHNPESRSSRPDLLWSPEKCVGCAQCQEVCSEGVHLWIDHRHTVSRERCLACGACAAVCYAGALEVGGRTMTAEEVMEVVGMDTPFYRRSGGGLTVSGGEPLAQYDFVVSLLRQARNAEIHTAVDTSGLCPWEYLEGLGADVDLFLYDLKHMDDARHRDLTGASNERILDNLRRLDQAGRTTWIRVPLIPGRNDDDTNYRALGRFLSRLNHVARVEILRYHPLAKSKYARLGCDYELKGLEPPSREWAESRRKILREFDLRRVVLR